MTTLTDTSIESSYSELITDNAILDPLTGPMLKSAAKENAVHLAWVVSKFALAFVCVGLGVSALGDAIQVNFFAAWSAAVALLYLANLADVSRLRDAVSLVVPAALVWGILLFDAQNASLVGLALFTHVFVAFFAAVARISGSLKDAGIWSLLFGSGLALLIVFVVRFLA